MNTKKFTPLNFLASLGAGGIAVTPFILMQYSIKQGPGLITRAEIWSRSMSGMEAMYYHSLEAVMVIFGLLHFALSFWLLAKYIKWRRTDEYSALIENPLTNSAILAPLISALMTMNMFIGPIRYFFTLLSSNFQSLFVPAFIVWALLFVVIMATEIKLLGISFRKGFDINKIHFGWLLHPFVLAMLTTVGTGLAAMSKNRMIADTSAFMSMISGSMGVFLLLVKMIMVFKSHFVADKLPEKYFLPSFLIVLPNITLFAISAFRFGHYLEKNHGMHLDAYFYFVIGISFAFEIWYMLFGLSLLKDYFKQNHFNEYYPAQWGLICPLVAFVALGAFAFNVVMPSPILYTVLAATLLVVIFFYAELLYKFAKCQISKKMNLACEY